MAEKTLDVVGIGNAIVDIIARCDDGFLTKRNLDKGFMRLIASSEAAELYEEMGPATERSGGSVANSIAGLAALGATCGFIGRVAADPVSYTHLTLPTTKALCRSRWSPYH